MIKALGTPPERVLRVDIGYADLRTFVADDKGYCIDHTRQWQRHHLGIPTRYCTDAWSLAEEYFHPIRQLIEGLVDASTVWIVAGSPALTIWITAPCPHGATLYALPHSTIG